MKMSNQLSSDPDKAYPSKLAELIAKVPHRHIVSVGRALGSISYFFDFRHRRIVTRNLNFIYSGWPQDKIKKIARRVFQNLAIAGLEVCQTSCFTREDVLRISRIHGEDILRDAIKSQRGIIFISAHIGNWEMAPLFTSCYYSHPVTSIARRLQSAAIDGWIYKTRTRFGNEILDKKNALPKMARLLRKGGTLGILIDQGTLVSEGVEVSFFDKMVTATPGAAVLARRYGSIVLPAYCIREDDGELTLRVEEPLNMQETDDSQADLLINTQTMMDAIEKMVDTYPEQWLWAHKRWKRHYPYLYHEDIQRRRRRREKRLARLERSNLNKG